MKPLVKNVLKTTAITGAALFAGSLIDKAGFLKDKTGKQIPVAPAAPTLPNVVKISALFVLAGIAVGMIAKMFRINALKN